MKKRIMIGEIFDQISKAKKVDDKKALLAEYHAQYPKYIECILRLNFDDRFESALPDTPTPYTPSDGPSYTSLWKECPKLYRFTKNGSPNLRQYRREVLWIQVLEGLSRLEAELLEKCIRKQYKGISKAAVIEVLPDLLPKEQVAKKTTKKRTTKKKATVKKDDVPLTTETTSGEVTS